MWGKFILVRTFKKCKYKRKFRRFNTLLQRIKDLVDKINQNSKIKPWIIISNSKYSTTGKQRFPFTVNQRFTFTASICSPSLEGISAFLHANACICCLPFTQTHRVCLLFLAKIGLFLGQFCEHTVRRPKISKKTKKFFKKSEIFFEKLLTIFFHMC